MLFQDISSSNCHEAKQAKDKDKQFIFTFEDDSEDNPVTYVYMYTKE